jgi:ketosteroid isomerase-like protein
MMKATNAMSARDFVTFERWEKGDSAAFFGTLAADVVWTACSGIRDTMLTQTYGANNASSIVFGRSAMRAGANSI